jgi:hypothetical protein
MNFNEEHLNELKNSFPDKELKMCDDAGISYILIPAVTLPEPCVPNVVDLLYCPTPRDGYSSRLLFAEKIASKNNLNWNTTTVILGKTWYAFSWKIDDNQSLLNSIFGYLRALR